MEKDIKAFDVEFIYLHDAEYEVQSKRRLGRVIQKMINKLTNQHTVASYCSSNFYLPKGVTIEDVKKIVSYYYDKKMEAINNNAKLKEEQVIEIKREFAMNEIGKILEKNGFKIAPLFEIKETLAFVETGIYKNEKYENLLEKWYKPCVLKEEVEEIFAKINKEEKTNVL